MHRKLLTNRKLLEMASKGNNARNIQFMTGYLCIFEIRALLAYVLQMG